jgi:ribosomal protein S18 acetylase RimI-like enzyme
VPAGALVGSVAEGTAADPVGSSVEYIGVLENARGRGVAKSLLRTIIADAARRGRGRVGLEVDADSPTGANGLYVSMGWHTKYVTESWHKDVPVSSPPPTGAGPGAPHPG